MKISNEKTFILPLASYHALEKAAEKITHERFKFARIDIYDRSLWHQDITMELNWCSTSEHSPKNARRLSEELLVAAAITDGFNSNSGRWAVDWSSEWPADLSEEDFMGMVEYWQSYLEAFLPAKNNGPDFKVILENGATLTCSSIEVSVTGDALVCDDDHSLSLLEVDRIVVNK